MKKKTLKKIKNINQISITILRTFYCNVCKIDLICNNKRIFYLNVDVYVIQF